MIESTTSLLSYMGYLLSFEYFSTLSNYSIGDFILLVLVTAIWLCAITAYIIALFLALATVYLNIMERIHNKREDEE